MLKDGAVEIIDEGVKHIKHDTADTQKTFRFLSFFLFFWVGFWCKMISAREEKHFFGLKLNAKFAFFRKK